MARSRYEHALETAVADGVLTARQADDVRQRAAVREDRQGRVVRYASWIGSTLVAVGIVLWVASNWQQLPDSFRSLLLALVAAAAIAGAWRLLETQHAVTGHGLLVIGGAAIGGTIFQVANWVHLPPDNPMLLGLWFVCLLPLAYAFRSAPMLMAALLVLPFWLTFSFGPGGQVTGQTMVLLFAATAVGVAGAAWLHGPARWPGFALVLRGAGTAGVLLVGFVSTFTARFMGDQDPLFRFTWEAAVWLVVALALLLSGPLLRFARGHGIDWDIGVLGVLTMVALTAGLGTGLVLVNVLYTLWVVALVLLSIQARDELSLNIALAAFIVNVVGRYFDFLFDEMDPAVFFIGGGLLLMGVALLAERLRRRVRKEASAVA